MSKKWTAKDMPSMSGKIAIVTGANSGLGLETSAGLVQAGSTVIMACRDASKAESAVKEVRRRTPSAQIEVMPLDLADIASVHQFAQTFKVKYQKLDLLCNTAGVMAVPLKRTRDGFEMQIGTNHLGHFALTGVLLDRLQATVGSRVVNVASLAHRWTRGMDLEDLNWERKSYKKWDAYGKSKLANLLFTFELDRRLSKTGGSVIAAAAHPGYSATNLQFVGPQQEQSAINNIIMKVTNAMFAQPASMGALPTIYAATESNVVGGDYFGPDGLQQSRGYPKKVGCRREAKDPELAARLWALSEKLTGVSYL